MKVAFLPVYANPYQRLLAGGLAHHGVSVKMLDSLPGSGWLREHRSDIDILHYHWLYGLYMARARTPRQVVAFLKSFRLGRALGYRTVWTAHNILPHRGALRLLHVAIRRMVMSEADMVITHCRAAQRELLARFPRSGPTRTIPLGTYSGVYPITMTRSDARSALGLQPDQFAYLLLGNIAAYKGFDRFTAVFSEWAAPGDVALIAGRDRDSRLVRRLRRAAARDNRIRLWPQFIPDNEMQTFLLAADVMVAPFERVLTSSSMMVGLSYGLPNVAPRLGCLPELMDEAAGLLFDAGDSSALGQALVDIKKRDLVGMGAAARSIAGRYPWDDIGQQTAAAYRWTLEQREQR